MKIIRTLIRWTVFAACLAGAVYGVYYYMQPKPISVDIAAVLTGPLVVTVDEDGKTRIKDRYIVSAPLNGRLARIRLKAGDSVQENETLLVAIAPRRPELLNEREKLQAEMQVKAREAALERAIPLAESAQAAYDYAMKNHRRVKSMVPNRVTSQDELDRASTELARCRQDVQAAIYAQHIAKYEVDIARAALLRTQQLDDSDYSDFEMVSPISGRVLRVLQESATVVAPGTPILELGDHHDLEVVVDVLSSDGVAIQAGAEVILERWGGEQPLHGQVRLVEPAAFTKLSALGVEEQRVNVIVDLLEPIEQRPTLGDGFRVEARIVTWKTDETIKVPTSALFREQTHWAVFVVDETNGARLCEVEIGRQNDLEAQVLDGLQPGDKVILHPSDKIEDGALVELR